MVYHRAALPLADAESFCRISFSLAGFLYRKRTGPKACPFLNRWEKDRLIVGCVDLEECLGMCTYGANLGSLLALVDVAAVGALPYNLLALGKYFALLYVSQQLEVGGPVCI